MKRRRRGTTTCKRGASDAYWALRGPRGDCFVCASFGEDKHAALLLFDSRAAAEEYLRCLSEPRIFLNTLELYGRFTPDWVRQEMLLPEVRGISRRKLWKAIEDLGVDYVAINPPTEGVEEEIVELRPSWVFETR